jgi:hypothetical protein
MARSRTGIPYGYAGLTLLLLLSSGIRADAVDVLAWQSPAVEKSLGQGTTLDVVTLTFRSTQALGHVGVMVNPAFRRFVRSLEPNRFRGVQPGKDYAVEVHFTVPSGQAAGLFGGTIIAQAPGRHRASLPISLTIDYGDASVSDTTHALSPATTRKLKSVTSDALTFSGRTEELDQLAPGDVVALAPTDDAPSGALRRVTDVTVSGTEVQVGTSSATLEDALTNGSVHVDQALVPMAEGLRLPHGVSIRRPAAAAGQGFYFEIEDLVLYDDDHSDATTNDRITASGSVFIDPRFSFDLVIESGRVKHVSVVNTTTETAEIAVTAGVTVTANPEYELPPIHLQPIVTFVSWLPVVIEPRLVVRIGVEGSVSVGISAGIAQQATLTLGLTYDDGSWTPVSSFTPSIDFTPPGLATECSFRAYAGPRLDLLLYGIAGPYFKVDGYLELRADLFEDPWWNLYGGVEAGVGVRVEIFGRELLDYEAPAVIGYRVLLAHAPSCTSGTKIVDAKLGWQDSGIATAGGDHVALVATGTWGDSAGSVDANGRSSQPCTHPSCPLVGQPIMLLVGRIGASGTPFAVGTARVLDAAAAGTLRFIANDVAGIYWDNTGSLGVSVKVCPP